MVVFWGGITIQTKIKIIVAILLLGLISSTPVEATTPQPVGVPGNWSLVFSDEFNSTSLNTTKWTPHWYVEGGNMNNVPTYQRNLRLKNGNLWLRLANENGTLTGAAITTRNASNFVVMPGMYAEARIRFTGDSNCGIYNWPAWWISGYPWPDNGENDIAEGLGCHLTVNYHSSTLGHGSGYIAGSWRNSFHTYGIYRKASSSDVYYDGKLVYSYSTADPGNGQNPIFNIGIKTNPHTGWMNGIRVDYIRVWA